MRENERAWLSGNKEGQSLPDYVRTYIKRHLDSKCKASSTSQLNLKPSLLN